MQFEYYIQINKTSLDECDLGLSVMRQITLIFFSNHVSTVYHMIIRSLVKKLNCINFFINDYLILSNSNDEHESDRNKT